MVTVHAEGKEARKIIDDKDEGNPPPFGDPHPEAMTKAVTIFYLATTAVYGIGTGTLGGFNMVTLLYCLMVFMRP